MTNDQMQQQQKNAITTIHSTNPEITALVTSFMNSESQFQQQVAGKWEPITKSISYRP